MNIGNVKNALKSDVMNFTVLTVDCLEWMKLQSNDSVDLCITSPPYNLGKSIHRGKDLYSGFQDQQDDYYKFITERIDEMMRITKKWVFFNIQPVSNNKLDVFRLIGDYRNKIKEIIIWHKKWPQPAINTSVLSSAFEFIIVFDKKNPDKRTFEGLDFTKKGFTNCWLGEPNNALYKDSYTIDDDLFAIFPLWLPKMIIQKFSQSGDIIYDPFLGSGTTLVAAKMLGRNGIGTEINEKYASIATERIQKTSEGKALKQMTLGDLNGQKNTG